MICAINTKLWKQREIWGRIIKYIEIWIVYNKFSIYIETCQFNFDKFSSLSISQKQQHF